MGTFDEANIERVKSIALNVRIKHKAMHWDISPVDLIKKEGLDYDEYDLSEPTFAQKIIRCGKTIASKIKAAIVVREKVILLDDSLHEARKPFGQAHELGHHAIPEHKDILYVCSEHDLVPSTRSAMEFEANIFASEILLPSPLLGKVYKDYPLSMKTILQLADLSGASIHSSAITYVNNSEKKCCLLILDKEKDNKGNDGLRLKKQIYSKPLWNEYKRKFIQDDQFLPQNHNLSKVVFSGKPQEFVENTVNVGEKTYIVHSFYNSYCVFALLF